MNLDNTVHEQTRTSRPTSVDKTAIERKRRPGVRHQVDRLVEQNS